MSIEGTAGPDHGRVGPLGSGGSAKKGDLWGHPKGLYILFLTEMWERFSYYGMRALLVLYMTKYLFLPGHVEHVIAQDAIKSAIEAVFGPQSAQALSSQIYGLYTGFVYLTPVVGGIMADRYLGQRKTVIVGGVIMAIGHFVMAFSSLFNVALTPDYNWAHRNHFHLEVTPRVKWFLVH